MRATRLTSSCSALRRRGGGAAAEPFAGHLQRASLEREFTWWGAQLLAFRVTRPRRVECAGAQFDWRLPSRQTRSLCLRLTSSPHRLTHAHPLGMISTASRVGNRRDRQRGLKARVGKGVASGVPVYGWPSPYEKKQMTTLYARLPRHCEGVEVGLLLFCAVLVLAAEGTAQSDSDGRY